MPDDTRGRPKQARRRSRLALTSGRPRADAHALGYPERVPEPTARVGTFAALSVRDFRLLLIGTTLSNAAQWIQQVTLGWLVYDLTGSGTALDTIDLVRSVAALGFAPIVGGAIDRFPRRRLMFATNGWLLAITLALGSLIALRSASTWAPPPSASTV